MARARFESRNFRHIRTAPAGVVYQGDRPFRYVSSSGERVTLEKGDRLSRRQYENLRYSASGWQSKSEYERVLHGKTRMMDGRRKIHEANAFRRWAEIGADDRGIALRKMMGASSEYSQLFAAALRNKFRDRGPDSPFAKLLTYVGLRQPDWGWNVGDTDKNT